MRFEPLPDGREETTLAPEAQAQEQIVTRIQESRDCENSPKNKFVQDAAIGLAIGALDTDMVAESIIWHGVNAKPIEGTVALKAKLDEQISPSAIVVEHAISHGRVGAASGVITFGNDNQKRFCHIFEFTSAKGNLIAEIKSYS